MKACLCTLINTKACETCPNNQDNFNELGNSFPNFIPPISHNLGEIDFKYDFPDPQEVLNKYAKLLKEFEDKQLAEKIKKEVEKQLEELKTGEKKEDEKKTIGSKNNRIEEDEKSCWNCGVNRKYNEKAFICHKANIKLSIHTNMSIISLVQSFHCNKWTDRQEFIYE